MFKNYTFHLKKKIKFTFNFKIALFDLEKLRGIRIQTYLEMLDPDLHYINVDPHSATLHETACKIFPSKIEQTLYLLDLTSSNQSVNEIYA
jgi:hypothetical protein